MFEYYFEICNKPKYLLTIGEELFIEIFPLLCLLAVVAVVILIAWIAEIVSDIKRRKHK